MQEMGVDTQDGTGGIAVGEVGSAVRMSLFGTFRTWRDVCRESVTCAEAEIPCRYKLLHLASAIHRSVAPIATAHRPSAGCPRCRAFPTSQIAKNALDRASSTSNRFVVSLNEADDSVQYRQRYLRWLALGCLQGFHYFCRFLAIAHGVGLPVNQARGDGFLARVSCGC